MYSGAQQHGILLVHFFHATCSDLRPTGTAREADILVLIFGASVTHF
jgi:hypothetical protein